MKLEDVGFVMNDKGIMELVDYELLIEKFIEKNKLIMLRALSYLKLCYIPINIIRILRILRNMAFQLVMKKII